MAAGGGMTRSIGIFRRSARLRPISRPRSGEMEMEIACSPVEALRGAFSKHKTNVRYTDDFNAAPDA